MSEIIEPHTLPDGGSGAPAPSTTRKSKKTPARGVSTPKAKKIPPSGGVERRVLQPSSDSEERMDEDGPDGLNRPVPPLNVTGGKRARQGEDEESGGPSKKKSKKEPKSVQQAVEALRRNHLVMSDVPLAAALWVKSQSTSFLRSMAERGVFLAVTFGSAKAGPIANMTTEAHCIEILTVMTGARPTHCYMCPIIPGAPLTFVVYLPASIRGSGKTGEWEVSGLSFWNGRRAVGVKEGVVMSVHSIAAAMEDGIGVNTPPCTFTMPLQVNDVPMDVEDDEFSTLAMAIHTWLAQVSLGGSVTEVLSFTRKKVEGCATGSGLLLVRADYAARTPASWEVLFNSQNEECLLSITGRPCAAVRVSAKPICTWCGRFCAKREEAVGTCEPFKCRKSQGAAHWDKLINQAPGWYRKQREKATGMPASMTTTGPTTSNAPPPASGSSSVPKVESKKKRKAKAKAAKSKAKPNAGKK